MRDIILSAVKRAVIGPFQIKSLPGQDIYLRPMSALEYLELGRIGKAGPASTIPFLLSDKDGNRPLKTEDIQTLNDGPIEFIDELFCLIMDNKLLPSIEDARGK